MSSFQPWYMTQEATDLVDHWRITYVSYSSTGNEELNQKKKAQTHLFALEYKLKQLNNTFSLFCILFLRTIHKFQDPPRSW